MKLFFVGLGFLVSSTCLAGKYEVVCDTDEVKLNQKIEKAAKEADIVVSQPSIAIAKAAPGITGPYGKTNVETKTKICVTIEIKL